MLSRKQMYDLLILRKREGNLFFEFPLDLIGQISDFHDPQADELGQLIADGKKNDVKEKLDKNPRLVLQAAKEVMTPGGYTFKRIMPYECALIGDPDMAQLVGSYFEKIQPENAKEGIEQYKHARESQFKRYEKAIDNMLKVKPYDFSGLIKLIKESSPEDVAAELATGDSYDPTYESALRTELETFRKAFAPRELKTPQEQIETMGFIYASLLKAFTLLEDEWGKLRDSGSNYNKNDLVWCQLIGFIERRLPMVDRQAFARGVDRIKSLAEMERTLTYRYDSPGQFPHTPVDVLHSGLGFDFAVSIYGECGRRPGLERWTFLKNYVEQKQQDLKQLNGSCNIQMHISK